MTYNKLHIFKVYNMKSSGTGETITETRKLTNIFITIKSCPMLSPNHSSFLPQETIDLLSVTTE